MRPRRSEMMKVVKAVGNFAGYTREGVLSPKIRKLGEYTGHGGFIYDEFELVIPEHSVIERTKDKDAVYYKVTYQFIADTVRSKVYKLYPGDAEHPDVMEEE
jgi:hypothetical protein